MSTLASHRRLDYHYIAMQVGFWAMFAAICAYQATLLASRGFSNSQVGLIMSIRCLAGIVCQPALGAFADRHPNIQLKHIVNISLGISFVAGLVFTLTPMNLASTIVIFIIIGGLEISSYPLMDAMAIQFINQGVPIRYSLSRGLGSLAYAVCAVGLGIQVGLWGVESTLWTHTALVLLEVVIVGTYPSFHGEPQKVGERVERPQTPIELLRENPRFTLMLLAVLCGLTGFMPTSNFLINVIQEKGGVAADLGLALFFMAGTELLTTLFFVRLLNRCGSGKLLMFSFFFCSLKAVALIFAPNYLWICGVQFLQMFGYGLFTPASVFYVNETVPRRSQVLGQTIMMVASNGLGGTLGNLMGGWALDIWGVNGMLICCATCCATGVVLAYFSLRGTKKPELTEQAV